MIVGLIKEVRAQPQEDFCGQPELHNKLMTSDSAYLARYEQAEEVIHQNVLAIKQQRPIYEQYQQNTNCPGGPDIYTVPIVFHIVHDNGPANISDSRVIDAVDNLNQAFRNQGYYDPSKGVDVRIEFCLAQRDTNDNQTNGITRTVSSQYTDLNKSTEDTSLKNLVRWNSQDYINVWVVDTICSGGGSCGTAGYATLAANHGEPDDGIVVEDDWISDSEEDATVLIHEMGHYFDLLHPFKGGCTNNNCLQDGDKICDTPPDDATFELSNCSNTYNSCSTDTVAPNSPFTTDVPDNHELYMDYSFSQCQNQFSQGQKDRMVAALTGVRGSLLESGGCVPVTQRDAALAEIKYPVDRACNASFQPVVTLLNRGTNPLTSADISISIDQTQQVNYSWSGNLSTDNSVEITLPQVAVSQSSHTLTAVVANANGAGNPDGYAANDTLCTSFSLAVPEDSICQDFESTAILPAKWSVENPANDYTWTDTSLSCNGTSLYLDAFGKSVQQDTFYDKLKLPVIDLSTYSSAQLTFEYAYKRTYNNRSTILEIYASENCGFQNDTLFSKTGTNLATTSGFQTSEWAPTSCSQWRTDTIDLTPYVGGNMQVSFANIIPQYYGQNIYIDNICLQGTPCTTSVDLGADTSICDTSYTIDAGGGYDSYQWSTADTTQTITVDSYGTGNYQVTVTEGVCTASDTVQVQLSPRVQIQLDSLKDVNCAGDSSGAIYTSTASGLSTLDYQWSNGDTTDDLENVPASSYSVTVTSSAGCADTASYTVQEPSPLQASVSSITNTSCHGICDGEASLTVSGGTPPYSYNWSGGNSPAGSSNNGLCPGNYNVTVTDANGCDTIVSVTITEPPQLTSSITDTINASCYASCNGFAVVTPSGGTSPYTYNWSGGLTPSDSIATGLCAGSYGVTVTDANGCTTTDSVSITEPPILTANVTDTVDVSCNGVCDGSATVTPSGGTMPYSYSWDNGSTDSTASGLCAGPHQVTVTDANNCDTVLSMMISQPPGLTTSITDTTHVSCNGGCDASATVTPSGGTAPYAYQWSSGANQTDSTNVALCAGTIYVTVEDANQCQSTGTVVIDEPDSLALQLTGTAPTCYGDTNGAVDLTVNGGTSTYDYIWSSGDTTQDLTSIKAGTYDVTVADSQSCTDTASITLQQPDSLAIQASVTDVACGGGSNGVIDLTVSGSTAPYAFAWSNNDSTEDISGLTAGSYTVTVVSDDGCQKVGQWSVQQSGQLSVSLDTTIDVSCYNSQDGEVQVQVTGGTTPYDFQWSNQADTQNLVGVGAGNYSLTVTDDSGCTSSLTAQVSQPDSLVIDTSTSIEPITCYGNCNGEITLGVSGGTHPYNYNWSNNANDSTITSLCAASYTVTVSDANGCQLQQMFSITEPDSLDIAISSNDITCHGNNDGQATVSVTGGITPYSYNWSNGGTNDTIDSLGVGTYSVTVTDSNQCTKIASVSIQQPSPLAITFSTYSTECDTPTGGVAADVTGGNGSYSFNWSSGETMDSIAGKAAGNYALTVTDSTGCTARDTAAVQAIGAPSVSGKSTKPVSCFGGQDGEATIILNGGAPPYSFNWSSGQTDSIATGLSAGSHTVTITDDSSCATVATVQIGQPSAISVQRLADTLPCVGDSDGAIAVAISGGTPGYNYLWNTGDADSTLTGVPAGSYSVTITDANNCTQIDTVPVYDPPQPLTIDSILTDDPSCYQGSDGSIGVVAKPYSQSISYSYNSGVSFTSDSQQTSLSAGTHPVIVQNQKGCTAMDTATLNNPTPISVDLGSDTSGCDQITLQVQGASGTYNWNTGGTGQTIVAQNSGSYIVTVTDNDGCTASDTVDVTIHSSPVVTLPDTTACDSAGLSVASGFQSYTWSNGDQGSTTTISASGTYWVDVVNAEGCSSSDTSQVTIEQPPEAGFEVSANGLTVSLTDTSNTSQSYWWDFGDDSATTGSLAQYTYDTAGSYTITQAVSNNCGTDTARNTIELIDTDIPQTSAISEVNVYPNPNHGELIVDMGQTVQDVTIQVVNVAGQTVDKKTWSDLQEKRTLHLPDKLRGVYWLHITSNNKRIVKKVICLDK